MKLDLLEDLYIQSLAELYDAEKQLSRTLPKIAKAMSSEEARQAFQQHIEETKTQAKRLAELLGRRAADQPRKSKAMSGLLAEARDLLSQEGLDPQMLEAALITAAQKVEANEITSYACAHNFARLLSFHDDLKALEDSFHEEEKMEERLAALSENLPLEELERETEIEPEPTRHAA